MVNEVETKLKTFFQEHTSKKFKKGEVLMRQQEMPEGIFFLSEGIVRMYTVSQDGEEYELNVYKSPSFFPVGWLINSTENRYYYEATIDCTVYIAPKNEFLTFLYNNHDIIVDLLKRVYHGLEGYFLRMETLLAGVAYYKTIAEIILSTQRFAEPASAPHSHHVKLTHHQIASRTGLSRETVTREIRKLQKKNLVTYEGDQLTVRDLRLLEEELSNS